MKQQIGDYEVVKSGTDLLVSGDPRDLELARELRNRLAARAAEARQDLPSFLDFVGREEHTRKRIHVAPHQRLMLDFVMRHRRSVVMLPVSHAKTTSAAMMTLFLLGQDPTARGAIISATEGQAEKVAAMVRDYITHSPELRLVFPRLRRSSRHGDHWTQTKLTIERPPGIRDPSLVALGVGGALAGARINWLILDDVLTPDNTSTRDQRDKVHDWIDLVALSRLDPRHARVALFNTPFHRDDILHRLMARGWAVLRMDVDGGVFIQDDAERIRAGAEPYDHDLIVPDGKEHPEVAGRPWFFGRLHAHLELPAHDRTLWPERMGRAEVEEKRREYVANPNRFAQLYMGICRDDMSARCKVEWLERCKRKAFELGYKTLIRRRPAEAVAVFVGVDPAFRKGEQNDLSAISTIAILPSKLRLLVDLEFGQWDGLMLGQKILSKWRGFAADAVCVEDNAAQDLMRQIVLAQEPSCPVIGHTTGMNKYDRLTGVEAFFTEVANGAWLLPSDEFSRSPPEVQALCDAALDYEPDKHTSDLLMSLTIARHRAFEWGLLTSLDAEAVARAASDVAASVLSR